MVFLRAGITAAEKDYVANETASRTCRAREKRLRLAIDAAHQALRRLAIAAANNSAAYLSNVRSPDGITRRLDADLRPRAVELARHVIPERVEALRRAEVGCNATRNQLTRLRRVIDDWQLAYLRTEADVLRAELSASAGAASIEALDGPVDWRSSSADGPGSSRNDPFSDAEGSHTDPGFLRGNETVDLHSGQTIRQSDRRGPRSLSQNRTPAVPVEVGLASVKSSEGSPSASRPSRNRADVTFIHASSDAASHPAEGIVLPSAGCRSERVCLTEARVFTADATRNFQRAAVASLALVALRAEGILRARKAFLPLHLQRMIRGRRAKLSSVAVAEFDGTGSPKAGAVLPVLCFYQDPLLMSGCNTQGASAGVCLDYFARRRRIRSLGLQLRELRHGAN